MVLNTERLNRFSVNVTLLIYVRALPVMYDCEMWLPRVKCYFLGLNTVASTAVLVRTFSGYETWQPLPLFVRSSYRTVSLAMTTAICDLKAIKLRLFSVSCLKGFRSSVSFVVCVLRLCFVFSLSTRFLTIPEITSQVCASRPSRSYLVISYPYFLFATRWWCTLSMLSPSVTTSCSGAAMHVLMVHKLARI